MTSLIIRAPRRVLSLLILVIIAAATTTPFKVPFGTWNRLSSTPIISTKGKDLNQPEHSILRWSSTTESS